MQNGKSSKGRAHTPRLLVWAALISALAGAAWYAYGVWADLPHGALAYKPREDIDASGFTTVRSYIRPWQPGATLAEIRGAFDRVGYRTIQQLDRKLAGSDMSAPDRILTLFDKALLLNYEGEPQKAYEVLNEVRSLVESDPAYVEQYLYTLIYVQAVTALRRGETENCVMCRGESSCILPIAPAAVHTIPEGSRLAIKHFTEYLEQFPDDLEARWLLNIAHMTLGEHPQKVDTRYLISLDHFTRGEFDIGRFRDIGQLVGVNRLNQAGGGIMDDFDNDGLLDIVITTFDPTGSMAFYRNTGEGKFEDLTELVGLSGQLGGLNCMQTDYNNDGNLDILVVRGAWFPPTLPIRPSLLRNNGNGTFTDVTREAGLLDPVNSIAASWADYDNDGWLDLFICCEQQPNRLYHNERNGTFRDVAAAAGLAGSPPFACKGSAWIDYDNDDYPDLFLNHLSPDGGHLYRNSRDGRFERVSQSTGIDGPVAGFSCWAWDYDNDGWLDLFATCYDRTVADVVKGLQGEPHRLQSNRLYRNADGKRFENVTREAGLDVVFATMGSNFGDFDNDGFLDMYLGTGDPNLATLVPNRMFKNVSGQRFAEVTASSGTGNLQKGHGVACGDWDRDGDVDVFIQMGGVINGDKYHNILFQNPGNENRWITLKLVGQKTNRAAIGARIKVVTAGERPQTIHRHISTGSSFGANPLEQTIGLGKTERIESIEVHWTTSKTTQVFRDVAVNQAIEVTEFAEDYQRLEVKATPIAENR
jgi:hypothetical protein